VKKINDVNNLIVSIPLVIHPYDNSRAAVRQSVWSCDRRCGKWHLLSIFQTSAWGQ